MINTLAGMAAELLPVPPHGTRRRYQLRRGGCRCGLCRAANARYVNALRHGFTLDEDQELEDGWEVHVLGGVTVHQGVLLVDH